MDKSLELLCLSENSWRRTFANGRPAGRPIVKIMNKWPSSASIWPPTADFGYFLPEDLPEDPLSGREAAGRPILKFFNKEPHWASYCHLWPASVTFCRRTSRRTLSVEDKLLEDQYKKYSIKSLAAPVIATYCQLPSLSAGGPPGGPSCWKTSCWKPKLKKNKKNLAGPVIAKSSKFNSVREGAKPTRRGGHSSTFNSVRKGAKPTRRGGHSSTFNSLKMGAKPTRRGGHSSAFNSVKKGAKPTRRGGYHNLFASLRDGVKTLED